MKGRKLKLLCGKYKFTERQALKAIRRYYHENPQYFLYDLPLSRIKVRKKDRYKLILSMASILGLQHIKSKRWRECLEILNREDNEARTLERLIETIKTDHFATITKLMHLLNPNRYAIVDKKIKEKIRNSDCLRYFKKRNDTLAAINLAILNDVRNNEAILRRLCNKINKEYNILITPLRAWDILLWSEKNQRKVKGKKP